MNKPIDIIAKFFLSKVSDVEEYKWGLMTTYKNVEILMEMYAKEVAERVFENKEKYTSFEDMWTALSNE